MENPKTPNPKTTAARDNESPSTSAVHFVFGEVKPADELSEWAQTWCRHLAETLDIVVDLGPAHQSGTYAPLRHKGRSAATEGTGVTLFEHLREMALATAGEASGNHPCGDPDPYRVETQDPHPT